MASKTFDCIISGGRVVDPETGRDEIADVGVKDGRIARVGHIPAREGGHVVQAAGQVVCPGFIDLHAHGQSVAADWMQAFDGVTTALELEVGVLPVKAWYERQQTAGRVLNYGASASWIFARKQVMAGLVPDPARHPMDLMGDGADDRGGWSSGIAPAADVDRICTLVADGLREGGIGVGIAHGYAPGAGMKEMTRICELAARVHAPTFTHIAHMANADPQSSEESYVRILGLAAATGAHMHICHLNSTSLHDIERCRALIREAQARGLPVTVEAYPYGTGATVISARFFAAPDFPERTGSDYSSIELIHSRHHVKDRAELLATRAQNPSALVAWHFLDLEREPAFEGLLDLSVLYPGGIIASDGMPWVEPGGEIYEGEDWPLPERLSSHPRSAGTFTKFIATYHRDRACIDLMEALSKCTLLPARLLEPCLPAMKRKGRLQEGCDADILVFDPRTIDAKASFSRMTAPATGVDVLLVGGCPVIRDGQLDTGPRPGQALRTEWAAHA
ncbi:amidohydrolase family protein [Aquabacter sediminis]|uniref:amidohydrolase family protein n=1 Tax=Aquabacter sediminis TaxID=3029197 RepID=UPI00237DCA0C|nr:amidohydrolase family protein [Aquabacter sp. P-9]MDE1567060.1 amidohydrolase family protein [Aquabacter sp. P-9]